MKIIEIKNPNELLTHRRFDVVIKYMYASNLSSAFYKNAYSEHIRVWNNFYENRGRKNGFNDFDNTFKSIINNKVKEPIPINDEGHVVNGAHRLAAALYHQRPINICIGSRDNRRVVATYKYFRKKGLPKSVLGRAAVEYAKLKSNTHVICLFPIAHTRTPEVMDIINEYSNVVYHSSEDLNSKGQVGLMKEIYLSEAKNQKRVTAFHWASEKGIIKKANECFMGRTKVSFVLVDAENVETIKKMKSKIRALFNVGNHSVHISDYHEDAIRISKTVFNENSIHFLNNRKNILFPNFNNLMNTIKPDDNKAITASGVLSLYGLRDCKDLDLIYYNDAPKDSHNQYLKTYYKLTVDDIINNPKYYLYYNGFKYASLNVVKNMKKTRNEPKDIKDIQLINNL